MNPYLPRPIDLPTEVPLDPAADLSILDEAKIFAAPGDPGQWPMWREQLARWRREASQRIGYSGEHYDEVPGDCFNVCLAWLWDGSLYDHAGNRFTVGSFLDAAERDFGGFDGVVLWHAYPVIGLDGRNQFDFYREVPGLREAVEAFQARGVRVFIDYNPWDSLPSGPHVEEVAELVQTLGVDGVFLDTLKEGAGEMRKALDAIRPGIVLEGESRVPLARIGDHAMSWAQWFADSPVPGVLRAKWFERRHMLHHTRRWHRSHLEELHSAWLNGCGMLVWESVFGVWVGWSERDRHILKAMRRVQKGFADWLRSEDWTPLAGQIPASRWVHDGRPLWTVANPGEDDHDGSWLITEEIPGAQWSDPAAGTELTVKPLGAGLIEIGGFLPAGGIAAVFPSPPQAERLVLGDPAFPARVAVRMPVPYVLRAEVPPGMVAVEGGRHELVVRYRQRETGLYGETPYVDGWKPLPPRLHQMATLRRAVHLGRFAIGRREVTRAEYAAFTGEPFEGEPDAPATGVDLDDARAYAAWKGLRLPTEDEWQLAAEQGLLERLEPLVWNLTESEHTDGRTRFSILKGGCSFRALGSDWYLDGGPQPPETSVKLLHLGARLTRSPSLGFRCAADLPPLE